LANARSLGTVVSLADSGNSMCAVLSSGKVECWGYNANGQLGNGTTASSDIPVAVHGITNAKAVSGDINGQSFCALLSSKHLDCWGAGGNGQLGDGSFNSSDVPVPVS
jgi:alpha-tubulin suppressor-like RCC1 family protein